jgi:cytochrome c oxidase cbb3-type subunit 3
MMHAYPVRPPADPAAVARGKQTFGVSCAFCHGSDARGGETGPNLVRSQLVLDDQHGETIAPTIINGRVEKGMPKFDFDMAQIADIAAFIHSLSSSTRGEAISPPVNIVVGDAKAGEIYFNGSGKCSSCHSVTGDLAGIGSKEDPKTLQNLVLSGGGGRSFGRAAASASHVPPTTVTVSFPNGQKYEGKLDHLDAFNVSLKTTDDTYHSFPIHGAVPQVTVHNPLQQHLDMLPTIKDADIHNLTAYLVTIK